jgi:hypothetical protein
MSKPSMFYPIERAKYYAWKKAEKLALTKKEYLKKYIKIFLEYFPDWKAVKPKL